MAKTYNNLLPAIYDYGALYAAYKRARRGKRHTAEVVRFEAHLEENLIQLQNELVWGQYRTGPYRHFHVFEPKKRLVAALPFRDRVAQHAMIAAIEPIWEARFHHDSYACRPGKGTHHGADRVQAMLRRVKRKHGRVYALKADVAKYFPSVDHAVLKGLLAKRIACQPTLDLLHEVIDSWEDGPGCGIPIGNLTSQLFANIYLHELDRYAKESLRERHYLRYMDDFAIIHHDKAHLHRIRQDIEGFLWERLRLETNHKTQVFPVRPVGGRPLDFLGYRIWPTHRRVRKDSVRRMRRRLRWMQREYAAGRIGLAEIRPRIQSWLSHAGHADSHRLRSEVMKEAVFRRPSC